MIERSADVLDIAHNLTLEVFLQAKTLAPARGDLDEEPGSARHQVIAIARSPR